MQSKGFTLIELIIVVVIIGVLGAIAFPVFTNLQSQARQAAEESIIGSVVSGIKAYGLDSIAKDQSPTYPAVLDDAYAGSASDSNMFFTNVLQLSGVTNSEWTKIGTNVYFTPTGRYFYYDPLEGSFAEFTPGGGGRQPPIVIEPIIANPGDSNPGNTIVRPGGRRIF